MDDLRKMVISSLETLKQDFPKIISWQYDDQLQNTVSNIELAITLLKAQEPIEPIEMIDDHYPIGDPLRTIGWKCGKCRERIAGYDNYCPNCGQEVKWE